MRFLGSTGYVAHIFLGAVLAGSPSAGGAESSPTGLAFITTQHLDTQTGPEARAALTVARTVFPTMPLHPAPDGTFMEEDGGRVPLSSFSVVWYHQGDSVNWDETLARPGPLESLRGYVEQGGALFLSGAALAMVHELGIEPVSPRRGGPGRDGHPAELVPVVKDHPVFNGLPVAQDRVRVSDAGYPAFADWHGTGGPRGGMLLARTPGGSENPVVEFAFGRGRIITMGWRLAHYGHTTNTRRDTLEHLTSNILRYLAEPEQWLEVRAGVPDPTSVALTSSDWTALALAVEDLISTFRARYPNGPTYRSRIDTLKREYEQAVSGSDRAGQKRLARAFNRLKREALLANPLLGFDRLLLVKRHAGRLGLPKNWQSNSSLPRVGYDNEIAALSLSDPEAGLTTVYRPEDGAFVGDVDLHFEGDRVLFSMPDHGGPWRVYEMGLEGSPPERLPLVNEPDVDNYDACYLPDGNIVFCSSASMTGVPCVRGSDHVCNLFLYNPATTLIRRLTFEQDHDWCPTVLNDGRVLYLRWEYSDIPHYVSRILFHMKPDGTEQMAYYGSNSYWPNALFYARPVPGHASRFVGVVGGHHDVPRMGELLLFDTARGRREAEGVVQRIPGRGKQVEPVILDGLVQPSWPKFLHPWPLNENYFLVSAQPSANDPLGLYLVDTFDNMLLIREEAGYALMEPVPWQATARPPRIPSNVKPEEREATVYLADVYRGEGLKGVPRGTVRRLRVFTYHFAYQGMGGQIDRVGLDGPWDIKRVLGTVPVEEDGSALFHVPANTPISIQPLDAEGQAVQLMRSWMTAMPGEVLSCVGCHEDPNTSPPAAGTAALARAPSRITPWYGPTRGFSFVREVQPVLDRYCVDCHHGEAAAGKAPLPDFTLRPPVHPPGPDNAYRQASRFSPAYLALRRYVRSHTMESDMHMLAPADFHADTTKLVQILKTGHHDVRLDREAWDRIITWIDLNTPAHGTWHEIVGWDRVGDQHRSRQEYLRRYANITEDPEAIPDLTYQGTAPATAASGPLHAAASLNAPNSTGAQVQVPPAHHAPRENGRFTYTVDLGDGLHLSLCRIEPCGHGQRPKIGGENEAGIDRPFWIAIHELTNEQFAQFDPDHDSRLEHGDFLQFSVQERGYPLNRPDQPVVRVSWHRAMAYCRWLSERTGLAFSLPTEAQWEVACRAGSRTPLWYGQQDADFAPFENLADARLLLVDTFAPWSLPSGAIAPWRPAVADVDDGFRVSAPVGSFQANPWGLYDMHGNVAEWTRSTCAPYPFGGGGRQLNEPDRAVRKAVRGGSWYTRPGRATSSHRLAYPAWQAVFDVGFRVVCESDPAGSDHSAATRSRTATSLPATSRNAARTEGPPGDQSISRVPKLLSSVGWPTR